HRRQQRQPYIPSKRPHSAPKRQSSSRRSIDFASKWRKIGRWWWLLVSAAATLGIRRPQLPLRGGVHSVCWNAQHDLGDSEGVISQQHTKLFNLVNEINIMCLSMSPQLVLQQCIN
ncbi:unnamed protein product, partial [Musa textilis]